MDCVEEEWSKTARLEDWRGVARDYSQWTPVAEEGRFYPEFYIVMMLKQRDNR